MSPPFWRSSTAYPYPPQNTSIYPDTSTVPRTKNQMPLIETQRPLTKNHQKLKIKTLFEL